jgi:hypothetical protein
MKSDEKARKMTGKKLMYFTNQKAVEKWMALHNETLK